MQYLDAYLDFFLLKNYQEKIREIHSLVERLMNCFDDKKSFTYSCYLHSAHNTTITAKRFKKKSYTGIGLPVNNNYFRIFKIFFNCFSLFAETFSDFLFQFDSKISIYSFEMRNILFFFVTKFIRIFDKFHMAM